MDDTRRNLWKQKVENRVKKLPIQVSIKNNEENSFCVGKCKSLSANVLTMPVLAGATNMCSCLQPATEKNVEYYK
jgi:hypothetical protein